MPYPWAAAFPVLAARLVSEFRGDYNAMLEAILSTFTGPDEPPQLFAGMLWVDTSVTPRLLKQRNSTNTGWVTRARVDSDFGGVLALTGGTMEGPVNMNGQAITNLPLGSGNAPARYADLVAYAKLDGTTPFTGIPSLPASDPGSANQAARKAYVDAKAIAGGAFTGQINMSAPPTIAGHLMRKADVENLIATHIHNGGPGGVKVQGANIASTGAPAGALLESDGSSFAAWVPRSRLSIYSQPVVISGSQLVSDFVGSASPGTWKLVDLQLIIGTAAVGSVIELTFGAANDGVTRIKAFVRPVGSGVTTAQAINQEFAVSTVDDQSYAGFGGIKSRIFVPLDINRRFEIAFEKNAGTLNHVKMALWVVGEF